MSGQLKSIKNKKAFLTTIPNKNDLFLGMIIFLVGGLRLFQLGKQGLFLDEAWSWAAAQLPLGTLVQLSFQDPHPILYYILLKLYLFFFPSTEFSLRLLSTIFSLGSAGIIMFAAYRWWDPRAAIYAGWIFIFSSFDIYYAQEARMYTLLGFLWIFGFFLLVESIDKRPHLLLLWSLTSIFMAWTHFYGLLSVTLQLFGLGMIWLWYRLKDKKFPIQNKWMISSGILTIIGILPVFVIALNYRAGGAGGAWIPKIDELVSLFSLISIGLTSARSYFLDSNHLVLPFIKNIPQGIWAIGGLVLFGVFAFRALWAEGKRGENKRLRVLFALVSFSLPVLLFLFLFLLQRPQWALKPFLGIAYLLYLWVGLGLSRSSPAIRRIVLIAIPVISFFTLMPYYTLWEKTDAKAVFSPLENISNQDLILLDRAYRAPVAFYYLGNSSKVFGPANPQTGYELVTVKPYGILPEDFSQLNCVDISGIPPKTIWLYDPHEEIRSAWNDNPDCIKDQNMQVFENGKWTPLKP